MHYSNLLEFNFLLSLTLALSDKQNYTLLNQCLPAFSIENFNFEETYKPKIKATNKLTLLITKDLCFLCTQGVYLFTFRRKQILYTFLLNRGM